MGSGGVTAQRKQAALASSANQGAQHVKESKSIHTIFIIGQAFGISNVTEILAFTFERFKRHTSICLSTNATIVRSYSPEPLGRESAVVGWQRLSSMLQDRIESSV